MKLFLAAWLVACVAIIAVVWHGDLDDVQLKPNGLKVGHVRQALSEILGDDLGLRTKAQVEKGKR